MFIKRVFLAAIMLSAAGSPALAQSPAPTATRPSLAGRWTLNEALSHGAADVGFGMDLLSAQGSEAGGGSPGESGGSAAAALFRESQPDARRRELLVEEVRNPSRRISIAQTPSAVAITDERSQSRTFHPDGREETLLLADEVPVVTITRWSGPRLEIRYKVGERRELRYTISRALNPPQLNVEIQFIERGNGDRVTRVYEPSRENEPPLAPRATPAAPQASASQPPASQLPPDLRRPADNAPPAQGLAPVVPTGPDAGLKGLQKLGVVVEDLGSQEAACGLRQAPLESAVAKVLTGAGLQVVRNSDEDTYLYVRIMSASAGTGLCVSRYDVFLYTHTMATLSYQSVPVLVQVSLFHKGGMSGGPPATHGESVARGVTQYVDEIAGRIRDVNK